MTRAAAEAHMQVAASGLVVPPRPPAPAAEVRAAALAARDALPLARLPAAAPQPVDAEALRLLDLVRAKLHPMLEGLRLKGIPVGEVQLAEAVGGCRIMAGGDEQATVALVREYLEFWVSSPLPGVPSPLALRLSDVEAQALGGPIRSGVGLSKAAGPGAGRPILLMHLSLLDPSAAWFDRRALLCLVIWSVERALHECHHQHGAAASTGAAEQFVLIVNLRGFGLKNFDQASLGLSLRRCPLCVRVSCEWFVLLLSCACDLLIF